MIAINIFWNCVVCMCSIYSYNFTVILELRPIYKLSKEMTFPLKYASAFNRTCSALDIIYSLLYSTFYYNRLLFLVELKKEIQILITIFLTDIENVNNIGNKFSCNNCYEILIFSQRWCSFS